jgi:hypothetical protein
MVLIINEHTYTIMDHWRDAHKHFIVRCFDNRTVKGNICLQMRAAIVDIICTGITALAYFRNFRFIGPLCRKGYGPCLRESWPSLPPAAMSVPLLPNCSAS